MPVLQKIAQLSVRAAAWSFEGEPPSIPKWVGLAVPHTSNWDGLLLVLIARQIGLDMQWMIKDNWMKGPMATLLTAVGAVPIDRSKPGGMVGSMIEELGRRERCALIIPPSGTRRRGEHWKSGFYHIARGAEVPIVPGYLDYSRKVAGLGEPITLTGDVARDMDRIRAFYAAKAPVGKHPELMTPIRLQEE